MGRFVVPLKKPQPNIEHWVKAIKGEIVPERPPMVEYLIDNAVMKPILTEMMGRRWVATPEKTEYMGGQMDLSYESREIIRRWIDNQIAFWYHMGYDFVRVEVSLPLPTQSRITRDTSDQAQDANRAWAETGIGPIRDWKTYEEYPWPTIKDGDFFLHQYITSHLPDGLGFITCHAGGVFEHLCRLLGHEGMGYLLYDNPQLFQAVTDRLGKLIEEYNRRLLQLPNLYAIFQGEDMGFRSATMISPASLKKYILPWHKKYAEMVHEEGLLYILHTCGCVDSIMDELINYVKIDGKHSFEDEIISIWESKKRWGDKIALLGGVDVDKLARYPADKLRTYVRMIMDKCRKDGRFAIGAGNSIPSYIPVENYLTMCDVALTY